MHDHDSRPLLLITGKMNDIRARGNEKALNLQPSGESRIGYEQILDTSSIVPGTVLHDIKAMLTSCVESCSTWMHRL